MALLPPLELVSPRDAIRARGRRRQRDLHRHPLRRRSRPHRPPLRLRPRQEGPRAEPRLAPEDIQVELGGDYLPWGEARVRAIVAPQCGYASGDGDIAILVLSRHLIGMPTSSARLESAPELKDDVVVFAASGAARSRPTPSTGPRATPTRSTWSRTGTSRPGRPSVRETRAARSTAARRISSGSSPPASWMATIRRRRGPSSPASTPGGRSSPRLTRSPTARARASSPRTATATRSPTGRALPGSPRARRAARPPACRALDAPRAPGGVVPWVDYG